MFEEINEKIDVVALFRADKVEPYKFLWGTRDIRITKINLSYANWEGRSKVYYFAVSDNTNYFKLRFDTNSLSWTLLETYVD